VNVYKRLMETTICSFSFRIKTFGCCCCCCWILLLPMSFPGCLSASLFLLLSEWLLPPSSHLSGGLVGQRGPSVATALLFLPVVFVIGAKLGLGPCLPLGTSVGQSFRAGDTWAIPFHHPRLFLSLLSPFCSPSYSIPPPPSHFPGLLGKIYDGTNRLLPAPRPTILPPLLLFLSFFPEKKIIVSTVTVSSGYFLSGQAAPVCPSRSHFTAAPLAFYCQSVLSL
jgi:hypothetical protein